jgi:serine/threonine protein kinase
MSKKSPLARDPLTILEERYDAVELLSDAGGMGVVYKCARDSKMTVVKCIRPELKDSTAAGRFKREMRILRGIQHPNVVRIFDFNDATLPYWYEMEYTPHGDLKQLIPVIRDDIVEIKRIFVGICEGLKHLHENQVPIIHRDLKPHNILIFENSAPKISDAGLARFVDRDTTALTYTGDAWGSFFYMSPEQIDDFKNVDQRTDIYALGVILYEMFTNSPDRMGVDLDTVLPRPFNGMVRRMTMRNPDQRYQSVADLLADYESKIQIYEQVSAYGDPDGDFNDAVAALETQAPAALDTAKLDLLLKILEDQIDTSDFVWKKIGSIPPNVIQALANQNPEVLEGLVVLYANAINKIMSSHFPFGLMNTWTDFLSSVYELTSRHATKRLCLDRITFMAFDKGQHYTAIKLKEMLGAFHSDRDIDVAISVFDNLEWKQWIAKLMKPEAMNPKLRGFLAV